MGKFIDMTGWIMKEHGVPDSKLTVIEKIEGKGRAYWRCGCECGNTTVVQGTKLRTGYTKSCGCLKKKSPANFIDETGNRHGKLVVLERAENYNNLNQKAYWKCKCDCGNITIVEGVSLRDGNTKSCGCLHEENLSNGKYTMKDITNERFGKLIALYPTEKRSSIGDIFWHCKCDCGNEKDINGADLRDKTVQSCGCLRMSGPEAIINQILTENNIKFIQEYRPKDKTLSFDARFDFYIPSLNVLIEYDGKQHFEPIEKYGGEAGHITTVAHDKEKTQWAYNKGISLIRIPYTYPNKDLCLEDLLPSTSSFIINKKIKYIPHKR